MLTLDQVKRKLAQHERSFAWLARQVGASPQYLRRAITGDIGDCGQRREDLRGVLLRVDRVLDRLAWGG